LDFRVPIKIDGVIVQPGDIVFGDRDGVVVIPRATEREVFRLALEKVSAENKVKAAIQSGMSATEAYRRFGVM
jgi:regulator of RNase E activity RraA